MPPVSYILDRSYLGNLVEAPDDAPRILNPPQLTGSVETAEDRHRYATQLIEQMRAKLSSPTQPLFKMPEDPEKRRIWAVELAKERGWI